MTGTTNDGAGRGPRSRPPADGSSVAPPTVPSQRAAGGQAPTHEVVVRLDASDESLDRVVAAAREAQAAGLVLHLVAVPEPRRPGAAAVARERLTHRLDMAAEVARALCPGLPVEVTVPGDADV
jgi:sugar phosphate isomerase/epimerase